jgi:hypothetical protein
MNGDVLAVQVDDSRRRLAEAMAREPIDALRARALAKPAPPSFREPSRPPVSR